MNKKILVSVIMASYNHEKYIKNAIDSVLNQTYKNIELIIIDDCSTDNTRQVLKNIKDNRIKKIYSTQNLGAVKNFNKLISLCQGDYVAFIGSDDIWEKNKLELQMNCFSNKNIGAVFSLAKIIDEDGNEINDDSIFNKNIFLKNQANRGDWFRIFFESGNHLCHPSAVVRKNIINEIGEFNPIYKQLHDFDYWIRLINKYDIYVLPEELVRYRRFRDVNKNLSGISNKSQISTINEQAFIIKSMFEHIDNKTFKSGFKDYFVNINSKTKNEIICEKFLILKKYKVLNTNNTSLAFNFLFNQQNQDEIIKLLENKYNYSILDINNDMVKLNYCYPIDMYINNNDKLLTIYKKSVEYDKLKNKLKKIKILKFCKIIKKILFYREK